MKSQILTPLWSVESLVYRGRQLGQQIGFPTANLDPSMMDKLSIPPKFGVYASLVKWQVKELIGATYYGPRFDQNQTTGQSLAVDELQIVDGSQVSEARQEKNVLEVYILDFIQEIYGEKLLVDNYQFIRPPIKFDSLSALKAQISHDVEQIRAWYTDLSVVARHAKLDPTSSCHL